MARLASTRLSSTPGFYRRRFCGAAAAAAAAIPLGLLCVDRRFKAMAATLPEIAPRTDSDKGDIRPFHVKVPEAELTDLRRRINATRWPERETVTDDTQGVQLATIQKLARYW